MTSNKLRAAAERLLDSEQGIGCGTESDYVSGGLGADDAIALARAYLAERDPTPVTEEWLRSVGLEYGARTKWNNGWSPGTPDIFGPTFRTPVAQSPRYSPKQEVWLYLSLDDAVSAWLGTRQSTILLPEQPTRGHVRRLAEALGIMLKESP